MSVAIVDSPEFKSGMTFLTSYGKDYESRKEQIEVLENALQEIQPALEEAKRLQDKIKELRDQNKASEKFLISMNAVVISHTGQPINNGPLFEQPRASEKGEGNEAKED